MSQRVAYVGFSDLVRCLRADIDLSDESLKALGFECKAIEPRTLIDSDDASAGSAGPQQGGEDEALERGVTPHTEMPLAEPVFWLVGYQPYEASEPADGATEHAAERFDPGADAHPGKMHAPFVPVLSDSERAACAASLFQGTSRSNEMDVAATVERFSRRLPAQIVRAQRSGRTLGEVIVLIDTREALFPLTFDYQRAHRAIADRWGQDLVHVITLPTGVTGRFDASRYADIAALPSGSRLVLLSDVVHQGWLSREREEQNYRKFQQRCALNGHQLFHWRHAASAPNPAAVRALLGVLALVRSAGPHRLRVLRQALHEAGIATSAADEIALWAHSERDTAQWSDWQHRPESRTRWIAYFDSLDKSVQHALLQALDRYAQGQSPELRCIEHMLIASFAYADKPDPRLIKRLHTSITMDENADAAVFLLSCMDCIALAAPRFSQDPDYELLYQDLARLIHEYRLQPRLVSDWRTPDFGAAGLSLIQQGGDLLLVEDPGPSTVLHSAAGTWFDDQQSTELKIGRVDTTTGRLSIRLAAGRLQAVPITQPFWAREMWRDRTGLFARDHSGLVTQAIPVSDHKPAQSQRTVRTTAYAIDRNCQWWLVEATPDWASDSGFDDFGYWAEFTVKAITQRLRWISPGEFLMGSPEDEPERFDRETLHHVTLTEGYWLAETACTQALWEAVMGSNPSEFKGPERPIETVSWDAVKDFIERLNKKVPGLQSQLPSEAQWEYAARAGGQSAFWWGSTLSPEQANYDGDNPYADGQKGQYRKETVAVKEFEANPWGLYQVHGNIWEWCEDWYGAYESDAAVNPRGAESGERRVIRGGGWDYDGGRLRAACRDRSVPDYRYYGLGFRLCAGQSGAEPR